MRLDQNTLIILMKISIRNRSVLEFSNSKGKRESRSKNDVNFKRTKSITSTDPLEMAFSSSPQYQLRNILMLCPLQSVSSDTSISFYNGSIENSFRENQVTSKYIHIEAEFSSPELAMMQKVPKQQSFDIQPIPF